MVFNRLNNQMFIITRVYYNCIRRIRIPYNITVFLKRTRDNRFNINAQISSKNNSLRHWILSSKEWGYKNRSAADILLKIEFPSWGVKQNPYISCSFRTCSVCSTTTAWFKIRPKCPGSRPNENTSLELTLSVIDILSFC